MQELLAYLRANGFKTFIVSGGSIEFMRPWTEAAYGIPPEQVVGSITDVKFEMQDNKPVLMRLPGISFVDDGPGKPEGIYRAIGRQPIAAFGNSDGDLQMLQWASAGPGPRLLLLVHHTDAEREWAYDRHSYIGRLEKALDEAKAKGCTVVSMKGDWATIFPEKNRSKRSIAPSLLIGYVCLVRSWLLGCRASSTLRRSAAGSPTSISLRTFQRIRKVSW